MKKIISMFSALALSGVTYQAFASNELCLANKTDCTFVLLSEKSTKQVSELINEASNPDGSDEVAQGISYSETSEMMSLVNTNRAKLRLSPFSTFKIPNTLIALATNQVTDIKKTLTYDKNKYPEQAWWPSSWRRSGHNLASAFKVSMVPIYRQIAANVGQPTMQSYVSNFTYGNQDISSGLDDFWLDGSLKISALEQVRFLQKMHNGKLAVSQQSLNSLKKVMLVETNDNYALYAKTGTGKTKLNDKDSKSILGWYVGFVENAQGVHYFAFNFTRDSYAKINAARVDIVRNHLKKAGII